MGLVQNLKKILKNSAEKILVDLLYLYIKQKAKQTSEKQVNSSRTMSSQNHLTVENPHSTIATSSEDSTGKITMKVTTEDIFAHVRQWSIERASNEKLSKEDANAILAEFHEWIELEGDELDIVSVEPQG